MKFFFNTLALACVAALAQVGTASAAKTPTFAAYIIDPANKPVGTAIFVSVAGGTQITVDVTGLPTGVHGMHIHEFGSCNPLRDTSGNVTPFGAAGGHFDPTGSHMHKGPDGGGHAGDLPTLNVDANGNGRIAFFASHLALTGENALVGRSLIIHANPDNFTDTPPNGGSGPRLACGEIGALHAQ